MLLSLRLFVSMTVCTLMVFAYLSNAFFVIFHVTHLYVNLLHMQILCCEFNPLEINAVSET
jgi:hypothetical protein